MNEDTLGIMYFGLHGVVRHWCLVNRSVRFGCMERNEKRKMWSCYLMFDIFLLPSKECCYMLCLDFFLDYCSFYYFLSNLLQKENDFAPKKEWACAKPYIEVLFLVFSFFFFCVSVLLLIELYLITNLKLLIPQQTQNYRICFIGNNSFT